MRSVLSLLLLACAAPPPAPPRPPRAWAPPVWLDHPDAWVLRELDGAPVSGRGPRVRALSAIVADLDRGEVLWARRPDEPVPVASVTKLASALTLFALEPQPDLDRARCVGPELWPPRPGALSRFETGVCHPGWDFLGSALVHSDNRGAMGLPWLAGVPYEVFVDEMGATVADLGGRARFADPVGLEEEDRASPRDVLRLVVAASLHPLVADLSTAPVWTISRREGSSTLLTTNRLLPRWETLAAKTGYTDAAGWCFATVVRAASGARIAAVVLGAPTDRARFDDVAALIHWAERFEG